MERKNAWLSYTEADEKNLEKLAKDYRNFLDVAKTERECAAGLVRRTGQRHVPDGGNVVLHQQRSPFPLGEFRPLRGAPAPKAAGYAGGIREKRGREADGSSCRGERDGAERVMGLRRRERGQCGYKYIFSRLCQFQCGNRACGPECAFVFLAIRLWIQQPANAARGSAGRADWLPRGKHRAYISAWQFCRKKIPAGRGT